MALSFLAGKTPPLAAPSPAEDGSLSYFDGALVMWNTTHADGTFTTKQLFRKDSPHTGRGRQSTATPPLHVHLDQTETLEVLEGTMVGLIDGVETTMAAPAKIVIAPGQVHTFWRAGAEGEGEDLLMQATGEGGHPACSFDERLLNQRLTHGVHVSLRRADGYLSSCVAAGVEPSPFQVFRFLDSAGVAVAAPLGMGRVMNLALGRIGGGLLGYKTEYDEFAAKEAQ
ncbi:hypothetical protein JCM3770_000955 [Rhodotorula araucariae]